MSREAPNQWTLSEQGRERAAAAMQNRRAEKERWLTIRKAHTPLYPPTNEAGSFVGLIGFLTGAGARIVPYYQTESGILFYEQDDQGGTRQRTVPFDLNQLIREQYAILLTEDEFLTAGEGLQTEIPMAAYAGTPNNDK